MKSELSATIIGLMAFHQWCFWLINVFRKVLSSSTAGVTSLYSTASMPSGDLCPCIPYDRSRFWVTYRKARWAFTPFDKSMLQNLKQVDFLNFRIRIEVGVHRIIDGLCIRFSVNILSIITQRCRQNYVLSVGNVVFWYQKQSHINCWFVQREINTTLPTRSSPRKEG